MTVTRRLSQRVPAGAPPGDYTYTGYAGAFPGTVLDADAFPFTKSDGGVERAAGARAPSGLPSWPPPEWEGAGWTLAGGSAAVAKGGAAGAGLPTVPALHAGYPNPSRGAVTLRYDVAASGRVRVVVYDLLGREVAVLADGPHEAGRYAAAFDGRELAAGVYLVRMTTAAGFTQAQRVTLMR